MPRKFPGVLLLIPMVYLLFPLILRLVHGYTVGSGKCGYVSRNSRTTSNDEPTERSAILLDKRIVGGERSQPDDWPWASNLMMPPPSDGNSNVKNREVFGSWHPICGATLIAENWAITAAHCTKNTTNFFDQSQPIYVVHVRDYDVSKTNDAGEKFRYVEEVHSHPNYSLPTGHDIALLKLKKPVQSATPVCLPSEDIKSNESGIVIGWGITNPDVKSQLPNRLRQVGMPIFRGEECSKWMKLASNESQFCAGSIQGGIDACQGDSGGPLLQEQDGHWVLIGIVSWGVGCAQPQHLGVYTNVYYFLDWMQQIIGSHYMRR